jgi:hypothetical protein
MARQHFEPTTRKPNAFWRWKLGVVMTAISIFLMHSVSEARAYGHSLKPVVLFCCIGLVVSLGLMTFGVDLSAGWP